MNTVQLHDRALGLLDQSRSGRMHPVMLDAAFNTVHINLLNQKTGMDGSERSLFFHPEESVRMKDALKYYYVEEELVSQNTAVNITVLLTANSLSPLMLLLGFDINLGSVEVPNWVTPTPVNKKDSYELSQNTFTKPQNRAWITSYAVYAKGIMKLLIPPGTSISQVRIGYLRFPVPVSHGIMIRHSDYQTDNTQAIVSSPKALYNGIIKFRGEQVSIVNHLLFTEGEVYTSIADADIDPQLIDVIVPVVAGVLSGGKLGVLNSGKEN